MESKKENFLVQHSRIFISLDIFIVSPY